MKLLRTIYIDKAGNEWVIQRNTLPKKKGVYVFWTAECAKLNLEYKENTKKELKKHLDI